MNRETERQKEGIVERLNDRLSVKEIGQKTEGATEKR